MSTTEPTPTPAPPEPTPTPGPPAPVPSPDPVPAPQPPPGEPNPGPDGLNPHSARDIALTSSRNARGREVARGVGLTRERR
jgi:hypothetical protein